MYNKIHAKEYAEKTSGITKNLRQILFEEQTDAENGFFSKIAFDKYRLIALICVFHNVCG